MRPLFLIPFLALLLAHAQEPPAPVPAPTIPVLVQAAQASYLKADYEAARQSLLTAWDLAQQTPASDPIRYDVLKRLSAIRAAAGEYADADDYLQLAISWREQNLSPNDPKIPEDVLQSVGYLRAQKRYDQALAVMGRVLNLHRRLNMAAGMDGLEAGNAVNVADDFSRIAQIDAELTKVEDAMTALRMALAIRTKLVGPFDLSLVYDLDRLGGFQLGAHTYDQAEETFRHALVIRETVYGRNHADLIATIDGLGYSLFGQKKYDAAEPVYLRFLALWINSVGEETHPMVAVAYDKLAIFYAAQKKWEQARDASARANAIRAYLLADGLSGEASQHIEEGQLADALPVYLRALKVLDPPNPIYDKERADLDNMRKEIEKVVRPPATAPAPASKKSTGHALQ